MRFAQVVTPGVTSAYSGTVGKGMGIAIAVAACVSWTGCGSDSTTTVINRTTTLAPDNSTSTVTTTTTALPPSQPPDECGEPGVVTGGAVGAEESRSLPGFKNLRASTGGCDYAQSVAVAFTEGWTESCGDGCSVNIDGLPCAYGGEGTPVECARGQTAVAFELAFLGD